MKGQAVTPPTRDELAPPQARPDERRTTTLTIDGQMARTPCALDNPDFADIKVTLSSVDFVGMDKAPGVSLASAYQGYLGRELPLSVMCDIRSQAAQILQREGYLATVEIPEQRIADGSAEFRVVFGRLTALRLRGDAGPSEKLVAGYLDNLLGQEVFNSREAERYLLLADDIPGLDVRLSLRPAAGGQPGDLVGEVAVLRRRAVIDLNVQNYGSKAIGRFGGLLRGEVYDLTGMGDRTSLALFGTAEFEEQQTVQLAHDMRLGSEGLILGGQVTYSWTNPDLGIAGFDVESETLFASLQASYPFIRSQRGSLWGALGFDYVDQDVDINDIALSRDRVRTAFARLDYVKTDPASIARSNGYTPFEPKFRYSGSVEIRQGFSVFDATPDCRTDITPCFANGAVPPSRIEADPTPLLVRMTSQTEYRPQPLITFMLGAEAQYSGDALPAFEEFSAGNYSIGRGYNPGAVLGDSGIGVTAEMRYGTMVPKDENSFAWQPYVFTDATWAWNEDPSRKPLNPDRLWSAGGGVRFAYGASIQGDVTLSVPLERPDFQPTRGDVRLLVSLTARLLPWRF